MVLTALVFLLILSALVLIHELGHFLVAKYFGIKVEEFGFGLPPRIFGIKRGETIYSINWLPIGGFVKLYGEDEAGGGKVNLPAGYSSSEAKRSREVDSGQSQNDGSRQVADARMGARTIKEFDRAFFGKTPWQRAAVVVAGVFMNVILACAIFYVYLFSVGFHIELPLLTHHQFFGVQQHITDGIIVDKVSKDSPAEKAGITPFVKIISINGENVLNVTQFLKIVNNNKGKEVSLGLENLKTNNQFVAKLTPRVNPPKDEGSMGIRFYSMRIVGLVYQTQTQKLFSGVVHPFNMMAYQYDILKTLIAASFKEKTAAPLSGAVSGPVGIYSVVGNILEIPTLRERILQILNLAGLLSISLAFFNILPIPALDGGRLFFILIEAVTGRKIPQNIETTIHTVGMAILLGLFVLITFQDIVKLFR